MARAARKRVEHQVAGRKVTAPLVSTWSDDRDGKECSRGSDFRWGFEQGLVEGYGPDIGEEFDMSDSSSDEEF